jgi:glycosyltransferase involved in cell wall biosynthesis
LHTRTGKDTKLSIVVPCFNEEKTLRKCIEKVLEIDPGYTAAQNNIARARKIIYKK